MIVEGKELFACHQYVFKLETHEVFYCEACRHQELAGKKRFNLFER